MLSHPLIVEAAETHFVPVAIKNNTKDDADAEVLAHFGEKTWNNPVVYFLDAAEKRLAPKLHDEWTAAALLRGMVTALEKRKRTVPEWLRFVANEEQSRRRGLERAVFSQG
ncbi:MAG: hypothetical protein NXI31_25860 [bacterium]|nr:hypothetical protein [bacterium]